MGKEHINKKKRKNLLLSLVIIVAVLALLVFVLIAIDKKNKIKKSLDYTEAGKVDFANKNYESAIANFKKSINLNPNNYLNYFLLASSYEKLGDEDKAIKFYRKSLSLNPKNSDVFRLLGGVYYRIGEYEIAIPQFKKAIALNPADYLTYLDLGNLYLQLGIYERAVNTFQKTLALKYYDYRTFYGLGLAYYKQEDYRNAYLNLKQAYSLKPNDKAVTYYLLNTMNALGLYDESIQLAKEKLATEKNNSHYIRIISISYFMKNDLSNAFENAQTAAKIEPDYYGNSLNLAFNYLISGKKQEAIDQFQTSLEIWKDNSGFEGLALSYYLNKDNENYQKYLKKTSLYQSNNFALSMLGFAMLNLKEYDKAIEEFNKATINTPEYYLPYKGLGKVYKAMGDREKTLKNLEKSFQLYNEDKEVTVLLQVSE